jgi:ribosomal protein S21
MSITIEVREGESFEDALRRFNRQVEQAYSRKWCKRRYGYYEKPSALRRKQRKMKRLREHDKALKLHIGINELFQQTGPTNAAGR